MVAFLEKSIGSEGFHQVIDFLNHSHIRYALTKKPEVYVSFINQFWRTTETTTGDNGDITITATIDGHLEFITEACLRRHLKLKDHDGITSIPNSEILEQLALMGYHTDSDNPKKTAWEQFSSNIATALICLATNRKYNFFRMIFEHMVTNIGSPHKFLMYHRITSSPLHSSEPSTKPTPKHNIAAKPLPYPTQLTQPSPDAEQHIPTPHDSPLHAVYSHGSDEGSLKLNELTNLVTKLSDRIGVLEDDLKKTKQTYSSAFTKLILRVKKLETIVKTGKARKRVRVVLSEDDEHV
ncbi:hypothetical protein Tco_1084505, partial [Tanacetum coccineum]